MPESRGSSPGGSNSRTPSEVDLAIAERLRNKAPELSDSLDAWISAAGGKGARADSIDVFLARLIREAKAALTEEKAELAVILATAQEEAVLVLDSMGVITSVCKHSSEILGRTQQNLIGRTIDSILTDRWAGIETSSAEMAQAAKGERVHSTRSQQRQDGTTFESHHTLVALVGSSGHVSGFSRSIEDVSQRRLHEVHIEELNASVAVLIREKAQP